MTSTPEDCHLRSCSAVMGYHLHAKDGDVGHVDDFLVDDRTWAIRYLVVNTSVKLTREEEHAMHAHYGRTGYWTAPSAEEAGHATIA
jgi:hypothetical protein